MDVLTFTPPLDLPHPFRRSDAHAPQDEMYAPARWPTACACDERSDPRLLSQAAELVEGVVDERCNGRVGSAA